MEYIFIIDQLCMFNCHSQTFYIPKISVKTTYNRRGSSVDFASIYSNSFSFLNFMLHGKIIKEKHKDEWSPTFSEFSQRWILQLCYFMYYRTINIPSFWKTSTAWWSSFQKKVIIPSLIDDHTRNSPITINWFCCINNT